MDFLGTGSSSDEGETDGIVANAIMGLPSVVGSASALRTSEAPSVTSSRSLNNVSCVTEVFFVATDLIYDHQTVPTYLLKNEKLNLRVQKTWGTL